VRRRREEKDKKERKGEREKERWREYTPLFLPPLRQVRLVPHQKDGHLLFLMQTADEVDPIGEREYGGVRGERADQGKGMRRTIILQKERGGRGERRRTLSSFCLSFFSTALCEMLPRCIPQLQAIPPFSLRREESSVELHPLSRERLSSSIFFLSFFFLTTTLSFRTKERRDERRLPYPSISYEKDTHNRERRVSSSYSLPCSFSFFFFFSLSF
jgi:hypothetical protein